MSTNGPLVHHLKQNSFNLLFVLKGDFGLLTSHDFHSEQQANVWELSILGDDEL